MRFTISEPARIEVLRRLAELNRQRYEEEIAQGRRKPKEVAILRKTAVFHRSDGPSTLYDYTEAGAVAAIFCHLTGIVQTEYDQSPDPHLAPDRSFCLIPERHFASRTTYWVTARWLTEDREEQWGFLTR